MLNTACGVLNTKWFNIFMLFTENLFMYFEIINKHMNECQHIIFFYNIYKKVYPKDESS